MSVHQTEVILTEIICQSSMDSGGGGVFETPEHHMGTSDPFTFNTFITEKNILHLVTRALFSLLNVNMMF